MSATLDGEQVVVRLKAQVVRSEGRSYSVDIRYLPLSRRGGLLI